MSKKVILLMVEGITDEDALALVFSKIAKEHELEFDVLRTDITAKDDITVKYIDEIIKKKIHLLKKKIYLKLYRLLIQMELLYLVLK